MTRHLITWILALSGVTLIVVGLSWNSLFPPTSYWNEDQAAEYNAAFNAVHTAQDASHHGEVTDHKGLDEARERFLNIRGDLEHGATSARPIEQSSHRLRSLSAASCLGRAAILAAKRQKRPLKRPAARLEAAASLALSQCCFCSILAGLTHANKSGSSRAFPPNRQARPGPPGAQA